MGNTSIGAIRTAPVNGEFHRSYLELAEANYLWLTIER